MNNRIWQAIRKAVYSIGSGEHRRVEGDGWTAYVVGDDIIRIDIRREKARA
jgi:hypothetical protein